MSSWLMAALEWTAEYQKYRAFGFWDTTVISAIMMVILTFPESYGIWEQGRTIRKERRGDSVSNVLFLVTFSFFLACIPYGYRTHSTAIIFNAVGTNVVWIGVLWALKEFKGFTRRDLVIGGLSLLMVPWMAYTEYLEWAYFFCSLSLWWAFGSQFLELRKEGKTGALDARLLVVYILSCSAWVVYAFSTGQVALEITQTVILVILVVTFGLWCRLKRRERQQA